ncbi:hypothetical protein ADIS_2110 [Lunatimonas lonarensis]|uniref:Uncharacterized protein n=1 Tax=Lunatimonas lonarensis TaxID=1232681 RepID=R7ZTC0_9BACT|nr:hypothetical protein [Lunatimonas lonarensis]EON77396.1 hypothetical protein ADIS_2110 [Lunatimonas lonarensis]
MGREKAHRSAIIVARGAAQPLVKNAHFRWVLAAWTVEEASLFRQNPVLFGSALSRCLGPGTDVSPSSQGFWRELVRGIAMVAAKTYLSEVVVKPRVETRSYPGWV